MNAHEIQGFGKSCNQQITLSPSLSVGIYENGQLELVPAFLYSFYLTFYKTDITLRRILGAGRKGVLLGGN